MIPIQEVGGRQSKNQNGIGLGIGLNADVMYTLQSGQQHGVAHSLRAEGFDASEDGTGRGTPLVPIAFHGSQDPDVSGDITHPLWQNQGQEVCIAFETRFARNGRGAPDTVVPPLKAQSGQTGKGDAAPCVVAPTLRAGGNSTGGDRPYGTDVDTCDSLQPVAMQVRRLTPRECERLQGFPDDYTMTPWRGKAPDQCPDGPRYKALGNSMAVPVIGWILNRVQKVEGSDG